MSQALVNQYGKPLNAGRFAAGPSRDSGALRGTIAGWHPHPLVNIDSGIRERELTQRRAADLVANDWAAKSGIRTIADNAIGTGLVPKSTIPHRLMNIDREAAVAVGEKMEWAWSVWSREAHARGIAHAEDLQYLGISSILRLGEMLHLPVLLPLENGRTFSLALQDMNPIRLATPADKFTDLSIRDGIEFTPYGKPAHYWIACPPPSLVPMNMGQLFSDSFTRRPARIGHRPNVFHLFHCEEEEQIRGVSALSAGMKLFRNLGDALDSELFAQVIAASFPVFMALEDGTANLPPEVREAYGYAPQGTTTERELHFDPGTVIFGKPGEKPQVLENKRPGSNFPPFVEIVERSLAAMLGIPYESLTKDFSKTNYSSMRAALNEAWKLYLFYRRWFSRLYTQPLWEMVIEEAYLRNFLGLADDIDALGSIGFYAGRAYWCNAIWVGPARGFIDPVKEIQAVIMALENNLSTYGEAWAERGGDFTDALPIMEEERLVLGKIPTLKKPAPAKAEQERKEEEEVAS
jgi:lambda family phage portal protein